MRIYYHGNDPGATPGILPGPPPAGPYYWWIAGAMWGTLIDYNFLTGDTQFNDDIMKAMQFQIGENKAYMPHNYTASLGNDDQGFWGLSALLAAETKFPDPPSDKPSWLGLAQAVWNTQASPERHDKECNGGLRWQIPLTNIGYDYKNTIANGIFFNMGARLARYTGNTTYSDYAAKTWDWFEGVQYLDPETWSVYDGGHVDKNCTDINKQEYSYNNAIWLQGSAAMYDFTQDEKWKTRAEKLAARGLEKFMDNDAAYEPMCEGIHTCTADMWSYKGYLHRWYAQSTQYVPSIKDKVMAALKTSAAAAAKQCTGGDQARQCGGAWSSGQYADNPTPASTQMSAVAAMISLLYPDANAPVTAEKGGTSKSEPNAGVGQQNSFHKELKPITTADKVGAGIVTFLLVCVALGMFGWVSADL